MKIITIAFLLSLPFVSWGQSGEMLSYQKATNPCLEQLAVLAYVPVDSQYQLVKKSRTDDIVYSIQSCGFPYQYSAAINDRAFSMLLPVWLNDYSISFGNDHFLISFDCGRDSSSDCIVLAYHFPGLGSSLAKNRFGPTWASGESLIINGKKINLYQHRTGTYAGELTVSSQLSISYYTGTKALEEQLRTCLVSLHLQ